MNVEDIQPKQDYPDKVEKTQHIEDKYKLNAEEINAMVEALKLFKNNDADPLANYEINKQ